MPKRSEMKSAITRLVQHQSFYRWDESAVPFGAGIDGCLREVLEIGKEMGFRTFRDQMAIRQFISRWGRDLSSLPFFAT